MKTILPHIKLIILAISFVMIACDKYEDHIFFYYHVDFPSVLTYAPDNVTSHTANLSGCVTSTGDGIMVDSGINIYESGSTPAWDQTPRTKFIEKRYAGTASIGVFSIFLRDLKPNTTYHYRAFASNEDGTSYGEMMVLVTLNSPVSN